MSPEERDELMQFILQSHSNAAERHQEMMDRQKEMAEREQEFGQLAEETGGVAWLPETVNEMMLDAGEAALDIDSQYIVTYKPQRPLAEAKLEEYRKLDVISRRVGLRVRSKIGRAHV